MRKVASLITWAIAHRSSIALADQGVVSGTNFLTSLIIARSCGKTELGVYLLAWTIVTMASEILTAVIITPYNVISPTLNIAQQNRYRGSVLLHQFGLSGLFAVGLIVASLQVRRVSNMQSLAGLLGICACLIVVLTLKEFSRRMFFAHLEMLSALATDLVACALQLLLVEAMNLTGTLSARNVYLAIAVVSAVPITAWLHMNRSRLEICRDAAAAFLIQNWRIAKWVLGSGVLWACAMYIYPWLLTWMYGASTTGIWAACYGLVALGNPVLLGFGNYLGPKIPLIYEHEGTRAMRRYVWQSSFAFVSLLAPFGAVAWFFGNEFVRHLYGPAFYGNTGAIRVLVLNVLISGAAFSFSRGLFSIQRADLDLAVNVLGIIILFLLGVPLVRSFGIIGAAVGLGATNGITALVRVVVFAVAARTRSRIPEGANLAVSSFEVEL